MTYVVLPVKFVLQTLCNLSNWNLTVLCSFCARFQSLDDPAAYYGAIRYPLSDDLVTRFTDALCKYRASTGLHVSFALMGEVSETGDSTRVERLSKLGPGTFYSVDEDILLGSSPSTQDLHVRQLCVDLVRDLGLRNNETIH